MMAGIKQHILIFLFLLIVFVPAVILSFFAVRAVNQEEMVRKRQLEDTLLLELDKTNTILNLTIDSIIQELHDSLPDTDGKDSRELMENWSKGQPLAGIPYILSDERTIIYPDIKSANPDEKKTADLFHWRYLNLFSNSESIPVYKNIAEEYEEKILDAEKEREAEKITSAENDTAGDRITSAEKGTEAERITAADKDIAADEIAASEEPMAAASEKRIDTDKITAAENNMVSDTVADDLASVYESAGIPEEAESFQKERTASKNEIYSDMGKQGVSGELFPPAGGAVSTESPSLAYGYEPESEDNLIQKKELSRDEAAAGSSENKMFSAESGASSLSMKKSAPLKSRKAIELFESDTVLQEEIYSRAEEEGQQYLTRNLLPQISLTERKEIPQTVIRSVYIESSKYFDEITAGSDYGIIPRTFDSTFILLFWEKKGNIITGCEINMEEFNRRLKEAAGNGENSFRYINIIDRSGTPLVNFEGIDSGKWRKPFVAKEISSILPYWETAILLRNPEEVEKQIESSKYFMSLVVFTLCALIFTGITAVYRFSSSRLKNIQQRVGFVTNVSHELKTPLTSIRMYSEMMAEGFQKDPEKIKKYSGYIASESQRLTRLINNVLDFAKLEKGTKKYTPETADINEIVKSMIPAFKEDFERNGFVFETDISTAPFYAYCDKEGIIQVLINLFSNVQKYSDKEKYIKISTFSENSKIYVNVEDRGKGIHRKYRKKIFNDFYRIDASITSDSKGTGLGLAIARKIMKQNSGDLVYSPADSSSYKKGSIFSLVIPAAGVHGDDSEYQD